MTRTNTGIFQECRYIPGARVRFAEGEERKPVFRRRILFIQLASFHCFDSIWFCCTASQGSKRQPNFGLEKLHFQFTPKLHLQFIPPLHFIYISSGIARTYWSQTLRYKQDDMSSQRETRSSKKRGREEAAAASSSATPQPQAVTPTTSTTDASQALAIIDSTSQDNTERATIVFKDEGGRFNTLAEFIQYLKDEKDDDVRYESFREQVEKINTLSEAAEQYAEHFSDIRKSIGLAAREEDKQMFKDMEDRATKSRTTKGRINSSQNVVRGIWGADTDFFTQHGQMSSQFWRMVQRLATNAAATGIGFKRALMLINIAILDRVTSKKRGVSTALYIQTTDIKAAAENTNNAIDARDYRQAIQAAGYGLDKDDVICLAENAVRIISTEEDDEDDMSVDAGFPSPGLGNQQGRIRDAETEDDEENVDNIDDIADLADHNYEQGGADFQDGLVAQETADIDDDKETGDADDDKDYEGTDDDEPAAKKRKGDKGKAIATGKDDKEAHKCGCKGVVSKGFLQQFKKGYRPTAIQHSNIVKNWMKYKDDTCYRHDALILSSLGMKSKGVTKVTAKARLSKFYEATIHGTLGDMKVNGDTYAWFRRSHRPVRADDALGPYKYYHGVSEAYRLTEEEQKDLCLYLGIDRGEWEKTGSINAECFGWWKDLTHNDVSIYDIALQEFDMYDHHLRLIDEKSNYGWLRTMFHGLAQQAMRQDPMYWMMYAALRKDRNADIVSYPYYAKYQKKGDFTFFRHIDINIPDLAKAGRGAYQIQGTVSLDEEREDDCTEIVPGMHHNITDWAKSLETREGVKLSGLVNAITDKVFSDEDKKKYGTDWVAVPCKLLQVRISQPHLPHGAQGPAKGVRRTMLPWFVTVQADGHHLEVLESGTWDDLAKAHRELTSAPRTPSGLANRYGDIPYAFPAAVPLTGLGALSDSLVCRYKPNNPLVMHVKKKLISGSKKDRDDYLSEWRKNATKAVVEAFEVVKALEKDAFKDKSYFKMLEQNGEAVQADDMPEGKDNYHFDPHGVRDGEAKEMAKADGSSDESGSGDSGALLVDEQIGMES
jgi:hypothetical protein